MLAPAAVNATVAAVLAMARAHHAGPATRPYFDTPSVAPLLLVVVLAWLLMEFSGLLHAQEMQHGRAGAIRTKTPASFWLAAATGIAAAETWLYLAPPIVPAAAIRPAAAVFAAGLVIFLAGMWLRAWSFWALGRYHSIGIVVCPGQPVIDAGPYGAIRHPGYAGTLLLCLGAGLMSANWASLAAIVALPLALTVWRIRIEERALLAALGDRYRSYAARHKRLIPLVW
jgi:protein-S-isoprenylcysteine O-methyltransferase Ste14